MTIDRGLDLLGVHLLAAHIDNAALAADEVVAVTSSLDHVAGIDEALGIEQRRRVAADVA